MSIKECYMCPAQGLVLSREDDFRSKVRIHNVRTGYVKVCVDCYDTLHDYIGTKTLLGVTVNEKFFIEYPHIMKANLKRVDRPDSVPGGYRRQKTARN